ncbi:hypothetical protein RchiOBHm_Chr6g0273421 [Rosa chinensis]|uniref:Uncharacterized protein n=1 Tax=Rosa chinensis TaxID=74649 RepID=A0A2P6PRG8_ROSCH|nr:hypothetical protein RchiOBHm_Chr6g0273421 [Rosa chinensis]
MNDHFCVLPLSSMVTMCLELNVPSVVKCVRRFKLAWSMEVDVSFLLIFLG